MLYTSYFAKLNKLPDNIVPISICGKAPDWYSGLQYKRLAPRFDMFMEWKRTHDNEYYIKEYSRLVTSGLDTSKVAKDLYDLSGGKDVALLCYEKPSDFCHRHLVAEWFSNNGIPCTEYEF